MQHVVGLCFCCSNTKQHAESSWVYNAVIAQHAGTSYTQCYARSAAAAAASAYLTNTKMRWFAASIT
jgi:hypothetical protein